MVKMDTILDPQWTTTDASKCSYQKLKVSGMWTLSNLFPKTTKYPSIPTEEFLQQTVEDILTILRNPPRHIPYLEAGNKTKNAIRNIANYFTPMVTKPTAQTTEIPLNTPVNTPTPSQEPINVPRAPRTPLVNHLSSEIPLHIQPTATLHNTRKPPRVQHNPPVNNSTSIKPAIHNNATLPRVQKDYTPTPAVLKHPFSIQAKAPRQSFHSIAATQLIANSISNKTKQHFFSHQCLHHIYNEETGK